MCYTFYSLAGPGDPFAGGGIETRDLAHVRRRSISGSRVLSFLGALPVPITSHSPFCTSS